MATQDHPPTRTRDRQTRRTKRALLAAADELFAEGRVPTVAEVAERADVGRATAYRYFPTQEALLLETTFLGDSEPMRALPELANQIEDPAERVAEAVRRGAEWTLGREARLRAILRMSLEPEAGADRPARRRGYIAQLLASVKDDVLETDSTTDPRFTATSEELEKKGVKDFQLDYAIKTLKRLAPGAPSTLAKSR